MILKQLLSIHKEKFRKKFVDAFAKANSLTPEQVQTEYSDTVDQYIAEKYRPVEQLTERLFKAEHPVLLNIRRDRQRDDKCKICEGNQPNIDEIAKRYWDRIEVIEIPEDRFEGGALYHIIFHEEAAEKKLPLTAVINKGSVLKFWAGKTVEPAVYEMYIKKTLS